MPDFLKRLLLLIAGNWIGVEVMSRNAHHLKVLLIVVIVMVIANMAIWKWKFE